MAAYAQLAVEILGATRLPRELAAGGSRDDAGRHQQHIGRQQPTAYSILAYASEKFRTTAGSTGMPGPVVVETVIFFR
jgi:hypothetical protein